MQITLITTIVCTLACTANAATYHVSPGGSDLADGLTPATAWATLNKVSAFAYSPGDNILLERGGAWRGKLVANSSGTLGEPITYSSYGDGAKPRILGSDVLNAAGFTLASGTTYELSHATPIGTVLADGTFLNNAWLANGRTTNLTQLRNYVDTNAGSYWYDNLAGRLYLNVGGDPVADGRQFTGVTRDDLVASNGHDHLVFNGLVVDESAIYDRGYGFRIEQSTGVQVLDSEAYRAGKHHFGVINSTGFVGRGLKAQLTMPNLTPGGASALVSFAGASVSDLTSVWDDVEISQTGDLNQAYLSHGSGLGHITLNNIRSYGSPISVSANTTATNLHLENAGIEIGGVGSLVNGARLVGSNANVTFWGDGTAVNLVVDGYFRTRGNASPIVVMEPNNVLAFSTIANAPTGQVDALITFARPQANLEMLGNVISELRGRMIGAYAGTVEDRLVSDYNVYEGAIFKLGWSGPTLRNYPETLSLFFSR